MVEQTRSTKSYKSDFLIIKSVVIALLDLFNLYGLCPVLLRQLGSRPPGLLQLHGLLDHVAEERVALEGVLDLLGALEKKKEKSRLG